MIHVPGYPLLSNLLCIFSTATADISIQVNSVTPSLYNFSHNCEFPQPSSNTCIYLVNEIHCQYINLNTIYIGKVLQPANMMTFTTHMFYPAQVHICISKIISSLPGIIYIHCIHSKRQIQA